MSVVLLTMFIMALLVTFAGFVLSYNSRKATQAVHAQRMQDRTYVEQGAIEHTSMGRGSTATIERTKTVRETSTGTRRVSNAYQTGPQRTRTGGQQTTSMQRTLTRGTLTGPKNALTQRKQAGSQVAWSLPSWLNPGGLLTGRGRRGNPHWLIIVGSGIILGSILLCALNPLFNSRSITMTNWSLLPGVNQVGEATLSQDIVDRLQGASRALLRINQMDNAQYASPEEYDTWAVSACSAASMTVVMNSYGHSYRITDVLKTERELQQITPELGMLYPTGIDRTVEQFGFQATHLTNPDLNEVLSIANKGQPVIVSFPPGTWSKGGHILVVRGGNDKEVYLADSSNANMLILPQDKFLSYWRGFAVVVTPKR